MAPGWRVLMLSIEFADPIFSGNGTLSRALAYSLRSRGAASLMVICAQPEGSSMPINQPKAARNISSPRTERKPSVKTTDSVKGTGLAAGEEVVLSVPVSRWYTLDATCAWEEYGRGAGKYASAVREFKPDIVLAVDWTSLLALQNLRHLNALVHIPSIYMNFRVFSAQLDDRNQEFYAEKEANMLRSTNAFVALSEADRHLLTDLDSGSCSYVLNPPLREEISNIALMYKKHVLQATRQLFRHRYCSLQSDIASTRLAYNAKSSSASRGRSAGSFASEGGVELAWLHGSDTENGTSFFGDSLQETDARKGTPGAKLTKRRSAGELALSRELGTCERAIQYGFGGSRPVVFSYLKAPLLDARRSYVTFCGRVCREKNTGRFVDIVVSLEKFLKSNNLVPCIVGPPVDNEYANDVYKRLDAVFPGSLSRVIPRFLEAKDLAGVWQKTVLNIHPALYEAYGMTVIEAGAMGVPTVMHSSGLIGAVDVLEAPRCSILADMTSLRQCKAVVKSVLRKRDILSAIGEDARVAALRWNQEHYVEKLFSLMKSVVQNRFRAFDLSNEQPRAEPAEVHGGRKALKAGDASMGSRKASSGGGSDGLNLLDEWMWVQMLEWIVADTSDDGHVVQVDLVGIQRAVYGVSRESAEQLQQHIQAMWRGLVGNRYRAKLVREGLSLSSEDRARIMSESRKEIRLEYESRKKPEHVDWARHIMTPERFPNIQSARYRLVPGRVPEVVFWQCLFWMFRSAILSQLRPDPYEKLQQVAMSKSGSELALQLAVVARSIKSLEAVARRVLGCKGMIVILAGFPSVLDNNVTHQKLDGPLGAVMLARAISRIHVMDSLRVVVERVSSFPIHACMGVFFGQTKRWKSVGGLTELSTYGESERVCVESFPSGASFTEHHLEYLQNGCQETEPESSPERSTGESNHVIAVERIGPSDVDGVYYSPSGKILSDVAPLHAIGSNPRFSSSAVVSPIPTVVGVGAREIQRVIRSNFPLGDKIVSTVETDSTIVGTSATVAVFSLLGALAIVASEMGLCEATGASLDGIVGTEGQVLDALNASVAAGAWDDVKPAKGKTLGGVSFDSIVQSFNEVRAVVLSHWKYKLQS